jgi:exopolysaccharide biosynthesis polyprenyl glycosylphosphotransferase
MQVEAFEAELPASADGDCIGTPPAIDRVRPRQRARAVREGRSRRPVATREAIYGRGLAAADGAAAAAASGVVLSGSGVGPSIAVAVPVMVLLGTMAGAYGHEALRLRRSTLDDVPVLVEIAGLFTLIVSLVRDAVAAGAPDPHAVMALWALTFLLMAFCRAAGRVLAGALAPRERCLVVGDTAGVAAVRGKIDSAPVNAHVVAVLPLEGTATVTEQAWLRDMVARYDVHRVIIAPTTTDAADTLDLIRTAKASGVRVSVLPRLFEVVGSSVEFDQLDGLTILTVRRFGLTRSAHARKRACDLVGSLAMLVAVAPLLAAIALAIRLEGPGPILFRQTRVGRGGRRFSMYKFRSMVPDAEARKDQLRALNETEGLFKIAEDPRITRVGRFLRRTSLDEMPQLINVLRGEMSLVGPRPLVVDEDAKVNGLDRARLHLTPGMTGPWQVLGSTRVPLQEMVGIDYLYVANWSLWNDVKVLLRTIPFVLGRRGL